MTKFAGRPETWGVLVDQSKEGKPQRHGLESRQYLGEIAFTLVLDPPVPVGDPFSSVLVVAWLS